jgi:hypothetical protein
MGVQKGGKKQTNKQTKNYYKKDKYISFYKQNKKQAYY